MCPSTTYRIHSILLHKTWYHSKFRLCIRCRTMSNTTSTELWVCRANILSDRGSLNYFFLFEQQQEHCGLQFKNERELGYGDIGNFFDNIQSISCEKATEMLATEPEFMPDHVDVAHMALGGLAILLAISSMICCCCCLCRKKKSNRV